MSATDIEKTRELLAEVEQLKQTARRCRSVESTFNLTQPDYRKATLFQRLLSVESRTGERVLTFSAEETIAIHRAIRTVRVDAQDSIRQLEARISAPRDAS